MRTFLSDDERICASCGKVSEKGIVAQVKHNRFFLCAKCLDSVIVELMHDFERGLIPFEHVRHMCVSCGESSDIGIIIEEEENWFFVCENCTNNVIPAILSVWRGLHFTYRARMEGHLLIDRNVYLTAGVHFGTKIKTIHSKRFVFGTTSGGYHVINISRTDARIRVAACFLSRYDPKKILICSDLENGIQPVIKFSEVIGAVPQVGHFIPGTLTNHMLENYKEVDVVVICDPHIDKAALDEALIARIPVVSLLNTDDSLTCVDLAIPANNRGRKSLALVFFLLARQILRERGDIPPDGQLENVTLEDFESKIRP